MLFCPKCGALMRPKMEKSKKVLACSCGYSNKKVQTAETIVKEVRKPKRTEKFDVVSEDDTTLPTTEVHCPQCNHDTAYWWTKQMRSSDEPETKFLKCEKCRHTWRDSS